MDTQTGDFRFGRSAFGGFNRRDVMNFIDKLQRDAAAKGGDPDAIERIERERDALEQENRRLREEIAQLRAQQKAPHSASGTSDDRPLGTESDEAFSATAETVSDGDAKTLSMRDVDEMVQKYFG